MMDAFKIIKNVVGMTTSVGSGLIVTNIVKAFMPPEQKILSKIATTTATVVVSSMLGDASAKYVEKMFDDAKDAVIEVKDAVEKEVE